MSNLTLTPAELAEDKSDYVKSGAMPCLVLGLLGIAGRLVSRRIKRRRPDVSDYLILLGALRATCESSPVFASLNYGFGRHIETLNTDQIVIFLKVFYAAEFFYAITITIVKLSILAFYCSMFPEKGFILVARCIGAFVIACCVPVYASWDPVAQKTAKCIDSAKFFIGNAIPNILTDTCILMLPIGKVWKLQVSRGRKIVVTGPFPLGSAVVIASILLLVLIFNEDLSDPTWGLVNAFTWSNIEVQLAVLSACLPTFRPLVQAVMPSMMRSRKSKFSKTPHDPRHEYNSSIGLRSYSGKDGFHYLPDSVGHENNVTSGGRAAVREGVEGWVGERPQGGIKVTHKISTESEMIGE